MAVRVQGRPGRRGLRGLGQGDLELAERERAAETTSAAPGVPTDGNRDSTPPATPSDETPSDDTGKDEAEDAVPDAQGNEGETDATPEPKNGADGEPDGEDVLSIPESREIGDDQAEREALIGRFGARTQMRDTYYPNLASFVELHVANMWPYQQGVMTKFLWVPDWWRYPPLIYQLDALWRAYENARRQPGQMMIFDVQRSACSTGCSTRTPASWPRSASTRTGTRPGRASRCHANARRRADGARPWSPCARCAEGDGGGSGGHPRRERPPRRPNIKRHRMVGTNRKEADDVGNECRGRIGSAAQQHMEQHGPTAEHAPPLTERGHTAAAQGTQGRTGPTGEVAGRGDQGDGGAASPPAVLGKRPAGAS